MHATEDSKAPAGFKGSSYEGFILLISLLSLGNLIFLVFPGLFPDAKQIIPVFDLFLSIIFLLDFLFRLFTAESKAHYVLRDWGWADLLSSVPLPGMKIFRLFSVARIVSLMRTFSSRRLIHDFSRQRADGAIYIVVFIIILLLEVCSILVFRAESVAADANIRTAADALWWAYVTVTTVGYGDQYPVTSSGRIVGVILMAFGVSVFGTIAGFLSNKLTTPREQPPEKGSVAAGRQGEDAEAIRAMMARQEEISREITSRLERIERVIEDQIGDGEEKTS
jgi:voltage-gated potassium channel